MINLTSSHRTVRETTAAYEYPDPKTGELVVEQIRVRYFSMTVAEIKKLRSDAFAKAAAAEKDPEAAEFPWLSSVLVNKLESLPDIVDGKNKPIAITVANLDKITAVNLQAINQAIEEDLVPNAPATK
jgi:hypothetical protein